MSEKKSLVIPTQVFCYWLVRLRCTHRLWITPTQRSVTNIRSTTKCQRQSVLTSERQTRRGSSRSGRARRYLNSEGARTTSSVVAFSKAGEALVGEVASASHYEPRSNCRSVKHMGENWKSDDVDGKQYTLQKFRPAH